MTYRTHQEILRSTRFRALAGIAILFLMALVGVVVGQRLKARNQSDPTKVNKDALVDLVEKSPDLLLGVQQDEDTPMRILSATVKEVSGSDYEKLTSGKADFPSVISAPNVKLLNVSSKTITRVLLIINDVSAQKSSGLLMHHLAISPGATFEISPANFVKPENLTTVDEGGRLDSSLKHPMKSKKAWLTFPNRSQIQVRVGVGFEDGTEWYNKEQRGERQ